MIVNTGFRPSRCEGMYWGDEFVPCAWSNLATIWIVLYSRDGIPEVEDGYRARALCRPCIDTINSSAIRLELDIHTNEVL